MLVVFVAQAEVDRQVVAQPPVVLRKQVQPVRPTVLVARARCRPRRRRIAEQEIGERVPAELAGVGEGAARVVRLLGPNCRWKKYAPNFRRWRPGRGDVVEQLEVLIVAGDTKTSGRPRCCTDRSSRSAGIPYRADRSSHRAGPPACEVDPRGSRSLLPPTTHPAKAGARSAGGAEHDAYGWPPRFRAFVSRGAETRHQGFLKALVPNG